MRSLLIFLVCALPAAWVGSSFAVGKDFAQTDPNAGNSGQQPVTSHWAFQELNWRVPPVRPDMPNLIDRFVSHRLHKDRLQLAPPATPVSWLRRVTLDLTGLPPTLEELRRFERELREGEAAFATAVDRLLASPRYGERWAQHWLDVVRYADTHGFEVNTERPHAWPYRDYVIAAFNNDLPYDLFVKQQIAGDLLGEDAATGFLVTASVLLPGQIGKDDASKRLARQDAIDEIVTNIGQTFLGLTISCARCHDHKFDPVSAEEYYAMQAFVAGVEYGDRPLTRSTVGLQTEVTQTDDKQEGEQTLQAFAGIFRRPDAIHLLNRGDPEQPLRPVSPAVPAILGNLNLDSNTTDPERRLALASWLIESGKRLTARVMVNRIWQAHFGGGLVSTPNDFGLNGAMPTHPNLLDWLAAKFIQSGWSVKAMHRQIVLSKTYRQSCQSRPKPFALDAESRLLWRFPLRRLEAEAIRDSILYVSGELDLREGGRGFNLFKQRGGLTGFTPIASFEADGRRRMIYAHKVRRERDAVFGAFDSPDAGQSAAKRVESTTPIQALNLLNSRFVREQAQAFESRVKSEVGQDPVEQIERAYLLALTRQPAADEMEAVLPQVKAHGLETLCLALFNSNEFLFFP